MRLVTPLLLILVAILTVFFITKPAYEQILTLRGDILQYHKAIEDGKAFDARITTLTDASNKLAPEDVARLSKMIPDTIDPARLIIELDTIAKKTGVAGIHTIKAIDLPASVVVPDSAIVDRPYGTTAISFAFSGTYEQFFQFLKGVESNLRLIDVTSLTFVPSETSSVYDFSVTVKTYWLKSSTQ